MMSSREEKLQAFGRLLDIMDELRAKCPWDKKQTMESLSSLSIEEVYELVDAIANKDRSEIKNELGDLMLHLVFYSKIASEESAFDVTDVLNAICEKLIYRHPHVYKDKGKVLTDEEVKTNWEKLKLKEGNESVLSGVPKSLPSLMKAMRIQSKVKSVGFDWEEKSQVFAKVKEEIEEFEEELLENKKDNMTAEFGDVLFSLVNYSRFVGINPDEALEQTNKKFIKRFQFIEKKAKQSAVSIEDLSIDEMNKYWQESKIH